MPILSEIKKNNRRKTWRYLLLSILVVAVAGGYSYYKKQESLKTDIKTFIVSSGTITSTLNSDGKVLYKEQYEINFPTSGTLNAIYKKEGDEVKKGDAIAKLDDKYLKIDVDKARISYNNAKAQLDAKLATKPQQGDVNISKAQLESSKTTLEANVRAGQENVKNAKDSVNSANSDLENAMKDLESVKNQENLNVANSKEKTISDMDASLPNMDKYLHDIDSILGVSDSNNNSNHTFDILLGAKDPFSRKNAENNYLRARTAYDTFIAEWNNYKKGPDYSLIGSWSDRISSLSSEVGDALKSMITMLKQSLAAAELPQATIDEYIAQFNGDINTLQSNQQKIILDLQSMNTASESMNSKILDAQNKIDSFRLKLQAAQNNLSSAETKLANDTALANSQIGVSQANLEFKKESFDPRELEPYRVSIESARKSLEEAQKRLEDATLRSPIDGKIGKLSITKIGTIVNQNPTTPFATIINKNSLYVEAKIEEGDIPKVHIGQDVIITFNSLENVKLNGKVSFISDKSESDVNGIVTYKVEIPFDPKDSGAKEGFTTQLAFIEQKKENILVIPVETAKNEADKSYVTMSDGTKRYIITGIDDGNMIEVVSGLKKGETIRYE